ncbi:hypothetical protein HF909_10280 [Ralstonia pseudosolanacearum]|uniref:Uncharacterized protein n=1 Tax=Ralstonia solanacearum TaxID=305 RepID=A0AA92QBE8_RALSL|nr:hypothetical protein [Ralstonia pseudosolanacearum]QOK96781.1 hypothetical protein HF909_10280 [Ralstonia pseudosolanacearum]
MAEKWLEREIARGLQGLLALRLMGAPADDSVTLTLDIWLAALEGHALTWSEQLDTERIRRAFRSLYRTCDRWPAPKHLLDNLGNRDPPKSLPAPRMSEAQRQRNSARLREIVTALAQNKAMQSANKEQ